MADAADLAQEREEEHRKAALAAFRMRRPPHRVAVPATQFCTFCTCQIDKGR